MEIKNKEAFKAELKRVIALRIKQFPYFFYGNILINIIIVAVIIATLFFVVASLITIKAPAIFVYGVALIAFLSSILSITMRDFFKNIRILNAIRAGHYDLGVEDYELDNTLEFIEQLPMSKSEVERMKIELSFGKLINVLDVFGIINCEGEIYNIDLVFKYETEEAIEKAEEDAEIRAKQK